EDLDAGLEEFVVEIAELLPLGGAPGAVVLRIEVEDEGMAPEGRKLEALVSRCLALEVRQDRAFLHSVRLVCIPTTYSEEEASKTQAIVLNRQLSPAAVHPDNGVSAPWEKRHDAIRRPHPRPHRCLAGPRPVSRSPGDRPCRLPAGGARGRRDAHPRGRDESALSEGACRHQQAGRGRLACRGRYHALHARWIHDRA